MTVTNKTYPLFLNWFSFILY